jgi:hypothetical protein
MKVSNHPLRERFLELRDRGELTASELARRVGWRRSSRDPLPDQSRVMRALGLRACKMSGRDAQCFNKRVSEQNALLLGDALGLTPYEVGL